MKPKLYPFLLIALTSIFFFSCKTASKLYQKGKYDEAVELAAKKLQKDPDDSKLLDIIRNSYQYAIQDHESSIRSNSESSNELKWEWMYNEYADMQKMYTAIYKVPQVYEIVHPVDYSSYLVTYGEKAGNVRYDRGMSLLQYNDKQSSRSAYREFQAALSFLPGDRDILSKLDQAYDEAVTNVIIMPAEQYGYSYSSYNYDSRNITDQLVRSLQYNSGNEFVKYYSSMDARSRDIRADQVVDMRFADMNIGRYRDDKTTREVSKEVVIKETVYRPDSIVKQYGKVTAKITTTHRTMRSDGLLQVTVRGEDGRWLWTDNITGSHNWSTEFSTYTGDSRALSDSDKQAISRLAQAPPSEDEVTACIIDEIQTDLVYRIRNHFSQY